MVMAEIQRRRKSEPPKRNPPAPPAPHPSQTRLGAAPSHPARTAQNASTRLDFTRSHPLKTKLFNLLNGDYRTAERLLGVVVRDYPGKNETWYYEKAIWDLTRDRH